MSVVPPLYFVAGVGEMRFFFFLIIVRNGERVVNVELIVCHKRQMVPKLSAKVGHVFHARVHARHHRDNGFGIGLPLVFVGDSQRVVHHVLHQPPVFGHCEAFARGIVVHIYNIVYGEGLLEKVFGLRGHKLL